MPCFSNIDYPSRGNNLTVKSAQTIRRVPPRDYAASFPVLCRLLALVLALAVAPTIVLAQEWDHERDRDHQRDKANDPTGAWLIRNSEGQFILTVFHKGGTLTGDVQGESAFIPGSPPPLNIIVTPESGVWQKTGWNTFAATFLTIEYQANPAAAPNTTLFQFDKVQFTGVLKDSGDEIELTALVTIFNPDGSQKGDSFSDTANGIRIPLEVLPSTAHSLPIPAIPTVTVPY
jgi:hypothetical protein